MARYDKKRKTQRDLEVLKYRSNNPDASLEEIGAVFGVSKQRISQILRAAKLGGAK